MLLNNDAEAQSADEWVKAAIEYYRGDASVAIVDMVIHRHWKEIIERTLTALTLEKQN